MPVLSELRRIRGLRALSQRELQKRSGVSAASISWIEAGREAHPSTQRKLAAALGVDPAELVEPIPALDPVLAQRNAKSAQLEAAIRYLEYLAEAVKSGHEGWWQSGRAGEVLDGRRRDYDRHGLLELGERSNRVAELLEELTRE